MIRAYQNCCCRIAASTRATKQTTQARDWSRWAAKEPIEGDSVQPSMPGVLDAVGDIDDDNVASNTNLDLAVNVGRRLPVTRARYDSHTIVVYGGRSCTRCACSGRSLSMGVSTVALLVHILIVMNTIAEP